MSVERVSIPAARARARVDGLGWWLIEAEVEEGHFGGLGKVPSIRYVGYNAVIMCGEKLRYGGAHVAGGDDGEGCVGCHCGGFLEGL